jgi:hypothetical protein
MRISSKMSRHDTEQGVVTDTLPQERHHSFWDWLFGNDVPEHDRTWYDTNLREGRTALSVLVRSDAEREQVADILGVKYRSCA